MLNNKTFTLLATKHEIFNKIIAECGIPPLWKRPNSFETFVQIILEQQVSLASAASSFYKLQSFCGNITPTKLLSLDIETLKTCYVSRQKASYLHDLSRHVLNGSIDFLLLEQKTNQEIFNILTSVKGIGKWSTEVYLMMVLHREDVFPIGDIALRNEICVMLDLKAKPSNEVLEKLVLSWQPYRTYAAFYLYWSYINRKHLTLPDYFY